MSNSLFISSAKRLLSFFTFIHNTQRRRNWRLFLFILICVFKLFLFSQLKFLCFFLYHKKLYHTVNIKPLRVWLAMFILVLVSTTQHFCLFWWKFSQFFYKQLWMFFCCCCCCGGGCYDDQELVIMTRARTAIRGDLCLIISRTIVDLSCVLDHDTRSA